MSEISQPVPTTDHTFQVYYSKADRQIRWKFDGADDIDTCKVHTSDSIAFSIQPEADDSGGAVVQSVLLSGSQSDQTKGAPFEEGALIDLSQTMMLKVGTSTGLWGFSIAFTVAHADSTTSFYFVPDPELQVGSIRA